MKPLSPKPSVYETLNPKPSLYETLNSPTGTRLETGGAFAEAVLGRLDTFHHSSAGAFVIRLGFGGILDDSYNKEAQDSVGNGLSSCMVVRKMIAITAASIISNKKYQPGIRSLKDSSLP